MMHMEDVQAIYSTVPHHESSVDMSNRPAIIRPEREAQCLYEGKYVSIQICVAHARGFSNLNQF